MPQNSKVWSTATFAALALPLTALPFTGVQAQDKPISENLARPAIPLDQARWARIIIESYPEEAIVNQQEGVVMVYLIIDTEGLVEDCRILRSSGHQILDQAACSGLQDHARFEPALNPDGTPTFASWTTSIVYQF